VRVGYPRRKARVRAALQPYFEGTHITFIGVPAGDERITQIRDALYARIHGGSLRSGKVRKRRKSV